jgi:pimeloyl-ACP methyl ester carboxylesterase
LETELRGRGHTTRALPVPGGSWDVAIAFVHAEVAGSAERGAAVLIGHALGGALVRSFATVHPDVAGALGTIATPPPRPPSGETGGRPGEEPAGTPTGSEPRVAILTEADEVVPYPDQLRAAELFRAPVASVPGGHHPHVTHPALVATLLANWLTPEGDRSIVPGG